MKPTCMKAMLAVLALVPSLGFSAQLTLNDFLTQVQEKNQGVVANKLVAEGTEAREEEGRLIFRPSLFAQGQVMVDKRPVANTATQGDRTDTQYATAGLAQNFNFGLKGQLSYTLYHTKIYNAGQTFVPVADFNDGIAKIELSQSLWRNWNGKENKAQADLIDAQAKASKHIANFTVQTTLASAESIYWSLSQTKKVIQVQRDNLARAQQIRSWNSRRVNSGLSERSDFLQADSNLKLSEYNLQSALQQQNLLQRSFNSMRGIDSNIVSEDLEAVDSKNLKALAPPSKDDLREDTKAALEQQNLAKASAALAIERNRPTFELYGSYAFNGRDPERTDAISNSFKNDHSTSAIGVRFNTPLDFGTTHSAIDGYKKEQIAAEYNYQRRVFDQDREWNDLITRFEDAKVRLDYAEKISEAQRVKTTNERTRLNNGRTTTFQVLIFELDLAQADVLRIQTETDLLNIYAQLKIFSAGGAK
ncbi:TolC family protein [Bacteriovorax sp. PP10]|uniref:TolC family protein n=1 Tax=Bacteriovorax antarcticus TaxID=3088717 RepID=A0ABU5VQH0_9BACT|nr:TolC family protein [Bacteriovorax sp. PP10]MEA9355293.1 TolC family protein [Bacteriovorax sp. PP10]